MRNPAFSKCKSKDADQLPGKRVADQPIFTLQIIQSLYFLNQNFPAIFYGCMACFVLTWSEMLKICFLIKQHLIFPGNATHLFEDCHYSIFFCFLFLVNHIVMYFKGCAIFTCFSFKIS